MTSSPFTRSLNRIQKNASGLWGRFRHLAPWQQAGAVVILILVIGGIAFASSRGGTSVSTDQIPTVSLASVGTLANGTSGSTTIIGTVRSIAEADILSQSGGTVRAVHTTIGAQVPAGFVIAELENASEQAAVLQAQGAYEGALAARSVASLQSGNAQGSLTEAATAARNTYATTYTSVDTVLHSDVDLFFGGQTAYGPMLLISAEQFPYGSFSMRRDAIDKAMNVWRMNLASASSQDPAELLDSAETTTRTISTFLTDLSQAALATRSQATPAQLAGLATARASIDGLLASLSGARDAYNAKKTAAAVGTEQTQSSDSGTASADAAVKQSLGVLRGAQANLEKTLVRAPIGGTVNFLPIHLGDYVTPLMHVATVAQNGALEVVTSLSEGDRALVAVGDTVMVEGTKGVVTSIAPALDPDTKQIEAHVGLPADASFENGSSVHITIPALAAIAATSTATGTPLTLPLTALKLAADNRVVFSVDSDGRLVSHAVEIGDVHGDHIDITTPLDPSLSIVVDARGLSEGEKVLVATSSAP